MLDLFVSSLLTLSNSLPVDVGQVWDESR